jgi:electron transfer flavoprotein alpha subunit
MNEENNVVVYLESGEGKAAQLNRGLLTEGSRIAALLGGRLMAVRLGAKGEVADLPEGHGVSTLLRVSSAELAEYRCETYAWALGSALKSISFRLLLFAGTGTGTDMAPRVASMLGSAAVLGCTDIRYDGEKLVYLCPLYGGQLEREVSYVEAGLEVATVRAEALYERPAAAIALTRTDMAVEIPPHLSRVFSHSPVAPDPSTIDIQCAKQIIGIGAGCTESMPYAEELSKLLNAAIATTRPVVDDGRLPKSRMIGQTGKTVAPDVYLALGVSGSPHHVAGIQQSKAILSVNVDPRAPIFGFSDTGFEADLNTLLPKLMKRIKRYRDEGGQ